MSEKASSGTGVALRGISASAGIGIGPAVVFGIMSTPFKRRHVRDRDVVGEIGRYRQGIVDAEEHLRQIIQEAHKAGPELAILEAYIMMLQDPGLSDDVERKISVDRMSCEWAVASAIREMVVQFEGVEDPYLRERSHDFDFVGDLLLRALRAGSDIKPLTKLDHPSVIVAHNLSPADTAALVHQQVLGIVTEVGTKTGHTAIIARALDIPAVVGVSGALAAINPNDEIVVDGLYGSVLVRPERDQLKAAKIRASKHATWRSRLHGDLSLPATMSCGTPIALRANIELPEEASWAVVRGAQGVGLYRTEFVYLGRSRVPTEQEQWEAYSKVVKAVSPHPVTLRTFDIGGDKLSSSLLPSREPNPALGTRAIRIGLANPDMLREQFRAMVRASSAGPIRIMVPMVTTVAEVRAAKAILEKVIEEVDRRAIDRAPNIPFGTMIEVPSAVMMADVIAKEVDFMSIGTNDLIQYTLAADRANRAVAYLASQFDPAIARLVKLAVEGVKGLDTSLSVCGEMASDLLGALLLIGLGIRELSMETAVIPALKEALRRVSIEQTQVVAERVLKAASAEQVEEELRTAFAAKLGDLLQPDG